MTALPFIFLTNELHVLSPTTLQNEQHPPSVQITKRFSNQQIQALKQEFEDVKVLGTATVEEWLKGLDSKGREVRNDAARWERWESSGGIERMRISERNVTSLDKTNQEVNGKIQVPGLGTISNDPSPIFNSQPPAPVSQANPVHHNPLPIQNTFSKLIIPIHPLWCSHLACSNL